MINASKVATVVAYIDHFRPAYAFIDERHEYNIGKKSG
jgi:hypothetical protein